MTYVLCFFILRLRLKAEVCQLEHSAIAEGENCTYGPTLVSEIFGFLHTLPVLLNRDDKSIISALRSSSATWLEVLTNRGSPTQILILSVLELQSSCVLLVVDPIEP